MAEIYLDKDEKDALAKSGLDSANSLYGLANAGALTAESCRGLSPQEITELETNLAADRLGIKADKKPLLQELFNECKESVVVTASSTVVASVPESTPVQGIEVVGARATAAMESKLGKMNEVNAKNFLGAWQRVWSKVPGTEPTDMDDISDAINQSRSFNEKLIAALTFEYNQNTTTLPVGWFSNMPGWFPALQKNHNFGTTPYNGKTGVEGKRAYILDTMNALAIKWEQADTSSPEWLVNTVESVATWALPLFGYPALLLFAGKVAYNMVHDGIKKPGFGEAAGWSTGKTWDGTKWVLTAGKSKFTTVYKWGSSKYSSQVEAKDLKDTPAYDADAWKKEKARLEETTRRMIYMDSGVNPRHNPNATSAEIFREVENTPALKTAFDARMKKLTELGNTLVGQDKYLSQEAFNKEAAKIVAGDIGENSVRKAVLKRVPFTAEREAFKQTQAALKKVKGEIDTMRARLSAKAMMDGVEIPKELESQLQAFEDAYKKAHEADFNLDKSRNNITKAYDRINAINEVISHFEDIEKWEGKITEVKQKIADVEARIAAQRDAAHTESETDRRNREVQGADEEIRVAKESLEQARTDQSKLESEIKDARRELKAANDRIDEREKELKDAIATREKELKDAIATREKELKDAIMKSESSQEAMNPEEVAKRDVWNKELRREEGDLKRLSDELNGSDAKLKSLKDELNNRTGELKRRDDVKTSISDSFDDLVDKKPAAAQKVADALTEYNTKVGDKRAILGRAGGVDAKSLTTADQVELAKLKEEKSGYENKIKEAKGKIDTLASANKGFPRSTGGTLALAQAELARTEALIAPGGTLDATKIAAKTARDSAFTHLNATITTLNTESARLGAALDIQIPHIAEFVKGQGFSEDLSMRENGMTGDKAADNKLKGTRAKPIETILKGGRHGPG